MAEKKPSNAKSYPSINKDVYSRFEDDGWGVQNVHYTKKGKRSLDAAKKSQKKKKK